LALFTRFTFVAVIVVRVKTDATQFGRRYPCFREMRSPCLRHWRRRQ